MQRHRFYSPPDSVSGSSVNLSRDETHHLARVLRLAPGDEAYVFDGCGREFRCHLSLVKDGRAKLEIIEQMTDTVESPLGLTLAQALAKGEKFDLIVQKATELGVGRIVPLVTEHTDIKLKDEQVEKRLERWRRISLEALKQSGRRLLVEITDPVELNRFAGELEINKISRTALVFSEQGGVSINTALAEVHRASRITALVGPEGGWSAVELDLLNKHGAKAVTLGPRVLRTETAAIVALTLIQHALGDVSNL